MLLRRSACRLRGVGPPPALIPFSRLHWCPACRLCPVGPISQPRPISDYAFLSRWLRLLLPPPNFYLILHSNRLLSPPWILLLKSIRAAHEMMKISRCAVSQNGWRTVLSTMTFGPNAVKGHHIRRFTPLFRYVRPRLKESFGIHAPSLSGSDSRLLIQHCMSLQILSLSSATAFHGLFLICFGMYSTQTWAEACSLER